MDLSPPDYDDLMTCYLDVCNQALERNKNRFPFKQILGAARESGSGQVIEVNIIGGASPPDYMMTFGKDGLRVYLHTDCLHCQCDRTWRVRRDYLEDVAKNPEGYIQNPAKIDWEWMYEVSK